MANNTTDEVPHGRRPGTELYGRGEKDALTDTAPGHGEAVQHGAQTGEFDREISVGRILWSGVWLTAGTLVFALLMWWFLRGIKAYEDHNEVAVAPMMAQNPQQPPPGPPLQNDPAQDMAKMRAEEDASLDRAGWVDQPGGTLRVPVDMAIEAVLQRGIAPFPGTGAPAVSMNQTPIEARTQQERQNPTDNRKPGATVQNTLPPAAAAPKAPAPRPPVR
jgi:hypothetical protein